MWIEAGKYGTEELKTALKISKRAWETRKDEVMEYIGYYFDYSVVRDGCKIYYEIKEQYDDWTGIPRKTNTKEMKEFYKEETHRIVDRNPWNTGSNVARRIINDNNKYSHAQGTAENYVRPVLKEDFLIVKEEGKWMETDYVKGDYIEISEEQASYLKSLFSNHRMERFDIVADVEAGVISKEEAGMQMYEQEKGIYDQVMKKFKAKYGFRPYKVPKYQAKAFKEEQR